MFAMNSKQYFSTLKQWRSNFSMKNRRSMQAHFCYCDICHDGCVIGNRYKCSVCPNFDLCSGCLSQHDETGHVIIRISSPIDVSWQWFYHWSQEMQTNSGAARLEHALEEGLAATLLSQGKITMQQLNQAFWSEATPEVNELFEQSTQKFKSAVAVIASCNIVCDECKSNIQSHRLTCITCIAYDLCSECEKAHKHDHHAMIRIIEQDDHSWLFPWFLALTPLEHVATTSINDDDESIGTNHIQTDQTESSIFEDLPPTYDQAIGMTPNPSIIRATASQSAAALNSNSGNEWIVSKELYKWDQAFQSLNPVDGKITGESAKSHMVKSNLPNTVLGNIWKLADVDRDGMLDREEFALVNYLINLKLDGNEMPNQLPPHLIPPSKRDSARANAQNIPHMENSGRMVDHSRPANHMQNIPRANNRTRRRLEWMRRVFSSVR